MAIEQTDAAPLYEQVKRSLLRELQGGQQAGPYLPPEPDLMVRFGVSRITIRRAVSELCEEGVLKKIHGRGTLIVPPKIKQTLVSLSGFGEALQSHGLEVGYAVVEQPMNLDLEPARQQLGGSDINDVVSIRRVILADGKPFTLETLSFLASRYGRAAPAVLGGGSFYKALESLYDQCPRSAQRLINVAYPSMDETRLLDCPSSQPVFVVEKTIFDEGQRPIAHSRLVTPADRVTYVSADPETGRNQHRG